MPISTSLQRDSLHSLVFWSAVVLVLLPDVLGWLQRRRRGARRRLRDDPALAFLLILAILVLVLRRAWLTPYLPDAPIPGDPDIVFVVGIALMLLGTAVYWWAMRTLGPLFTRPRVATEGGRLIEAGPYRLIRHPAYAGRMLVIIGVGCTTGSVARLIVAALCAVVLLGARALLEERSLLRGLGEPYEAYVQRTRRFIPRVF